MSLTRTPHRAFAVLALSFLTLGSGCSSPSNDSEGATGAGGASSGSTPDCAQPCEGKAMTCGATADQAKQGCIQLCAGGATESQLACLEAKSCGELSSASSIEELCPAGSGPASSGASSTSSSSTGGLDCPMPDPGTCIPYRAGNCSVYPDYFLMSCTEGATDLQKCSFVAAGCDFYCCTM